jgi:hypothetical protein
MIKDDEIDFKARMPTERKSLVALENWSKPLIEVSRKHAELWRARTTIT